LEATPRCVQGSQTLNFANKIHKDVLSCFTYVSDKEQYGKIEHWTSHAVAVTENKEFSGDCDDFALTCAELLIKGGVPKNEVSIIYCLTEEGDGHLVCGYYLDAKTWILDNRRAYVYVWDGRSYTWKYFMKFSEPGEWYDVQICSEDPAGSF